MQAIRVADAAMEDNARSSKPVDRWLCKVRFHPALLLNSPNRQPRKRAAQHRGCPLGKREGR